jgi:hypothetical protein
MKKNIYLILLLAFVITSGYTQGLSIADQGQPTKKWKRTHFYVSWDWTGQNTRICQQIELSPSRIILIYWKKHPGYGGRSLF